MQMRRTFEDRWMLATAPEIARVCLTVFHVAFPVGCYDFQRKDLILASHRKEQCVFPQGIDAFARVFVIHLDRTQKLRTAAPLTCAINEPLS